MSMELPPGTDLSKIPLLPNPDGSPPNFVDPPSLDAVTYAVSIIMMLITFSIFVLRITSNLKVYKKLAIDDYCCIVAWVLSTAYSIIVMTSLSTARHIWDVPMSAIDDSWIKRSAVLGTIYGPAMWLAKTAILTMYMRLFSVLSWMQWCCHIGIWFLFVAYWSLVPVSAVYNFPHGNEKWDLAMSMDARPAQLAFVIIGLISIISDCYILILPLPILLRLKMSWRRRLGLCLVFMTAAVGIVSSVVVFYLRLVLWKNETTDMTWNVAASYLTVAVEMNVAVLISCTPATVASWNAVLQDSFFITSLRSIFSSNRSLGGSRTTDQSKTSHGSATKSQSKDGIHGSETSLVPLEAVRTRA